MKKRRTKKDELLDIAKKMPPLRHKLPGEDFEWRKSQVIQWLILQPEIMDFIWESIHNRSESARLVMYDKESGTWRGVDYHGNGVFYGNDPADSDISGT